MRDLLLGRQMKDLDVAVEGAGERLPELLRRLAARPGWRLVAAHERFGTATFTAPGELRVDLAATRTESYPAPASLPVVVAGAPIGEDLARRDFTIHAIARRIGADGALGPPVDPFGGLRDLEKRVVRLLHENSLVDDPTRAFRAVKYAVRLGFGLERGFRRHLARARRAGAFGRLSGDRLRKSLEEVLCEDDFGKARALLLRFGLLDDVCPGWSEVLEKERSSEGRERPGEPADSGVCGRLALLLAPLSPSRRVQVAERLKFSRALRRSAGVPLR